MKQQQQQQQKWKADSTGIPEKRLNQDKKVNVDGGRGGGEGANIGINVFVVRVC